MRQPRAVLNLFLARPLGCLGAVLVFCVLVVYSPLLLVPRFHAALREATPRGETPLNDLSGWPSVQGRNGALKRFEGLVAALGIDAVGEKEEGARPDPQEKRAYLALRQEFLDPWLEEVRLRPDDSLVEPPREVAAFLRSKRSPILELRSHLESHAGEMAWPSYTGHFEGGGTLNLMGPLLANRVLFGSALVAEGEGDVEAARAFLDAGLLLGDSLRRRPEMLCVLIAIAMDAEHHALARRLSGVDDATVARLRAFDTRRACRDGMRAEAVEMLAMSRNPERVLGPRASQWHFWPLRPWTRIQLIDQAARLERRVWRYEAEGRGAFLDASRMADLWKNEASRWSPMGRAVWPSFEGAVYRAERRRLDQELTALVVGMRNGRIGPGRYPSEVLPGDAWVVSGVAGRLRVDFSRAMEDAVPMEVPWLLPLSHVQRGVPR